LATEPRSGAWIDVETARTAPGLRLVLTRGVPGPWGEAAKAIFHVKRVPFARVAQAAGGDNDALRAWTGRDDAPVAVWNDEPPRHGWADIALLAERIAPDPPLVPRDVDERALVFGLGRELCGELGVGWCRRLMLVHQLKRLAPDLPIAGYLAGRYGYDEKLAEAAPQRVADIVAAFGRQLGSQRARGRRHLVGDGLTVLDLWWSSFAAMLDPLPEDLCPMRPELRASYVARDPIVRAAIDPALMEHRNAIYRDHLELPIDLG
jgi:glutathione S-transferase